MFGHYLHKTKHGTSPVILCANEVVHASTGSVVLATPEVLAPTPAVAVPSRLEVAESLAVAGRPVAPILGLAMIPGWWSRPSAWRCLRPPNTGPQWLRRWS
jgi:hypothetical protein